MSARLQAPAPLPSSRPGDPRYPGTRQHLLLIEMARRHGWRRGAEIGLLKGKTFGLLLDALPGLELLGVDQWRQLPEDEAAGSETYARFDMAAAEASCRAIAAGHPDRARILKGDSVAMAVTVADGSLDFVFIDAAHTTAAVAADVRAWAPKVRPGGLITGHDWWFDSVRAALDLVVPGWEPLAESVWSLPRDLYTGSGA